MPPSSHIAQRSIAIAVLHCALGAGAFGQARLVFNNDAWLRIDNGAWVVVENPANAGIQTLGTGGNIRSEGEFNRIRWQIRNTTGVYTVPFTTANGVKMPFTYEAIGGASNEAAASVCFSTFNYGGIGPANWDNNSYRPSDVTHMHNFWTGAPVNNSDNVVDRFWILDPGVAGFAYGTRPGIRLDFTYDPGAGIGDVRTGNAITGASTVGAQRFNTPLGQWGDFWPAGTFAAGAINSVTNVNVGAAHFFRSWTLSNILQPLPVELVRFSADCDDARAVLRWTTASESEVTRFMMERSLDGVGFESVGEVNAVGSPGVATNYVFVDPSPGYPAYYRLRTVEASGAETASSIVVADCMNDGQTVLVNAWDGGETIQVVINSASAQLAAMQLYDAAGRLVFQKSGITLLHGLNTLGFDQAGLAMGIYTLAVAAGDGTPMTRRVPLY
ncbi:MAG: T9SS type A sorting domain-containing protein [Flavobacteriales bacterium]|nr:T9SS type A sorting domain-containing protein [Flavobacteriales bacterium]